MERFGVVDFEDGSREFMMLEVEDDELGGAAASAHRPELFAGHSASEHGADASMAWSFRSVVRSPAKGPVIDEEFECRSIGEPDCGDRVGFELDGSSPVQDPVPAVEDDED